jgi:hypothetical protein
MLTLTTSAAALLSERLKASPLAPGAGLRIWGTWVDEELVLTCNFTEGPAGADQVVEEPGGARIFIDHEVAPHLEHKTVSIREDREGIALVVIDEWWAEDDTPIE